MEQIFDSRPAVGTVGSLGCKKKRVHVQQDIFEKTILEVGTSHLYASFGIFFVQIGQSFEGKNDVDFEFFLKIKITLCLE